MLISHGTFDSTKRLNIFYANHLLKVKCPLSIEKPLLTIHQKERSALADLFHLREPGFAANKFEGSMADSMNRLFFCRVDNLNFTQIHQHGKKIGNTGG